MSFESSLFFLFVASVMILYYVPVFRRFQVLTLIIASSVFYGYNHPRIFLLLLLSVTINAYTSYKVYFCQEKRRIFWITLGIFLNVALLVFFKERLPIITAFFSRFKHTDPVEQLLLTLALPIGISFYTFESISLLIDAFQSKKHPVPMIDVSPSFAKHWTSTAFFILFFPKLLSGPIIKAKNFWPQITPKSFGEIPWDRVIRLLILGYFFKVVVANNLSQTTFWIADPYFKEFSSATLVTLLVGYSVQIFSDFAGYTLIAIAIALMFGYKLPINFDYPYISKSVTEFWRRWHISLSDWLREYLYFPLGGSRKGKLRTYANLIIIMVVCGLWHGATLGYLVWGFWHGFALAAERFFKHLKSKTCQINIISTQHELSSAADTQFTLIRLAKRAVFILLDWTKIFAVFCFVSIGWLVFKLPDFHQVLQFIVSVFNNTQISGIDKPILFSVVIYSFPVFFYHLMHLASKSWNISFDKYQGIIYGTLLFLIVVNGGDSNAFIYFQF